MFLLGRCCFLNVVFESFLVEFLKVAFKWFRKDSEKGFWANNVILRWFRRVCSRLFKGFESAWLLWFIINHCF